MLIHQRLAIQHSQNHFANILKKFRKSFQNKDTALLSNTFELLKNYELLASDYYRLKRDCSPTDPLRLQLEDHLTTSSHELLSLQKDKKEKNQYRSFVENYRRVWRENFSLFLFTLFLFVASALLGWYLTLLNPNYALAFIPSHLFEDILERRPWFEGILMNQWADGVQIALNNIMVAIHCFVLGALLGLGGMYILSYNGLLFGAVLGFCYVNHFHSAILHFVTGHGPLELTIIIASAFTSFLFGRVFYMRPYHLFAKRMAGAAHQAKYVLLGILPWLLLAATVEVFVSPLRNLDFTIKILISILITFAFWSWTLGFKFSSIVAKDHKAS